MLIVCMMLRKIWQTAKKIEPNTGNREQTDRTTTDRRETTHEARLGLLRRIIFDLILYSLFYYLLLSYIFISASLWLLACCAGLLSRERKRERMLMERWVGEKGAVRGKAATTPPRQASRGAQISPPRSRFWSTTPENRRKNKNLKI